MIRAEAELGNHLSLKYLPDVIELLVIVWSQGKIPAIDAQNKKFIDIFAALADHVQGIPKLLPH